MGEERWETRGGGEERWREEWTGYGEKLEGVEGWETIIRICCMRKESIFNNK